MVPKSFMQSSDKFDNFTKQVINILPDGNADNLRSGNTVRFTLPPGSTFSLSNLALHFTANIPRFAQQIGNGALATPTVPPTSATRAYTIYPPKYIQHLYKQLLFMRMVALFNRSLIIMQLLI